MVISDVITKSTGDVIRDLENTSRDTLSLTGRKFPFFDTSTVTDRDFVGGVMSPVRVTVTTLSTGSFDSYGNLLNSSTTVTDDTQTGDPTYTAQTTATYSPLGSVYCAAMPLTVVVTETRSSPSESASRNVSYTNDTTHCRVQSQITSPGTVTGGTPSVTTSYSSFDAFGNVTEVDVTGTGLGTRTTTYSYTGGNNEFPTTITQVVSGSVSLISHAAWNYALGLKTSTTDPNGNVTSVPTTAYDLAPGIDGFGRVHQLTRPDGSASVTTIAACSGVSTYCPSGSAYEVSTSQHDSGTSSVFTGYTSYDSWGRSIEQGKELLGGVISKTDSTYDLFGHASYVKTPYLTTPGVGTTYTYDLAMGRLTEVSAPQDATDPCSASAPTPCHNNTSFTYSGFSTTAAQTVTNSASSSYTHSTTSRKDALGEMLSMLDSNGGTTVYGGYVGSTIYGGYDAFGDLTTTTDADGKITTIGYDGLGHKTSMMDPNMGTWSYQVDALGETTCQTDAKLQSIVLAYDNIGRLLTKKETSPQTGPDCTPASGDIVLTGTWAYDTATHGLGLPASLTDSSGFSRSYDYDSHSRSADAITTPGGSTAYTMSTAYDTFGRLATLTYPAAPTGGSRFAVNYGYDSSSGALVSVSDGTTTYWQAATGAAPVDAFGHLLGYVDGNSVGTVSTYDQATGATLGISTGVGSSTSVQSLTYTWDGFGNLKQRCDANRGLTEAFTYDALESDIDFCSQYGGHCLLRWYRACGDGLDLRRCRQHPDPNQYGHHRGCRHPERYLYLRRFKPSVCCDGCTQHGYLRLRRQRWQHDFRQWPDHHLER